MTAWWLVALTAVVLQLPAMARAAQGSRLLATGGVTQIEGAAGGGLVPWAVIAGYGSRDQIGATAFYTSANPSNFRLDSAGLAIGVWDRIELSYAQQRFGLGTTVPGQSIRQDVYGIKLRLVGDAIFDADSFLPQIAVGAQAKHNLDFDLVPRALGARSAHGVDYYVAATKLIFGAVDGRNLLLNATLRATKANQLGLLGFGGDLKDAYSAHFESSAGIFLSDGLLVGVEYRHKPDNLSVFREDSFRDIFLTYLPNKYLAVTGAYAKLGNIADKSDQRAVYFSLQLSF
jgi:hypothetical protein